MALRWTSPGDDFGKETCLMDLSGRGVIVTGASRQGQMGEHLAQAFAGRGASVVVAARTEANVTRIAEEIKGKGGRAIGLKADGTVEADVLRIVDRTLPGYMTC